MATTIVQNRRKDWGVTSKWILWGFIAIFFVASSTPKIVLAAGLVAAQMPGDNYSSYQGSNMMGTSPLGTSAAGCRLELSTSSDVGSPGLGVQHSKGGQGRSILIVPTLAAKEIYSDNVTLAPQGHKTQDFVTDLMPGLTACQMAPRITSHFHYHMDSLYYAEHQSRNAIFNTFNGSTHAVVLKNHLYFDASTDYGLAIINPSQPYSLSPVLDAGNRTDAWTFSLSPYFVQPVGPLGVTITRYTYNRALYNDPRIPAFFSNGVSFNLINAPNNGNWSWDASYGSTELVHQGYYRKNYIDIASLQLGYEIAADLKLVAQGGVEDRYLPDGTIERLRSPFWNAGIDWSDGMSSLELRFGHRFFGSSFYGRLEHQGRHLTISISYAEAPQISGLNNMGSGLYGMPTATGVLGGAAGINQSPSQSLVPLSSLLDNRIYLRKSLVGSISYQTGRSKIYIGGYRIRDRYLQFNTVFFTGQQDTTGGDAYWRWQWQPRLYVVPRFSFEKLQYGGNQTYYLTSEYLSLILQMSSMMQGTLMFEHQQRIASTSSTSYQENAVILEIIRAF